MKATAEVFFIIVKEGQISKDLFSVLEFIPQDAMFSSMRDAVHYAIRITRNEEIQLRLIEGIENIFFSKLVREEFYKVYAANLTIKSIDELLYYRDKLNKNDKKTITPVKYTIKINEEDEGDEVENTEKLEFLVVSNRIIKGKQVSICSFNGAPIYFIHDDNS